MNRQPLPRALLGTVRAQLSPADMFRDLNDVLNDMRADAGTRMNAMEANLHTLLADRQSDIISSAANDFNTHASAEPDYSRAFASYTRSGDGVDALKAANASGKRASVQAAMSVGSNTDGGYLAPVEWDRRLQERQRTTSPMRRLASVRTTTVGAYTTLWNNDGFGSGWVGETAVRPATTTGTLAPLTFGHGEIYANAAVTQRLLDDSLINVDSWLVDSLEREFGRQENIAFLSGDGINKPTGLLTYAVGGANAAVHPGGPLNQTVVALGYDGLIDFIYALDAPYRANASFLMSSLTAAAISKLKDANNLPIWRESMIVGQPATLLGRPVEIDEGMPGPASGNLAVAFGDFRAGYVINDRFGTRVLRDPYSNKPYVMFYCTKRVGAGLLDPFAIRLLKVA